MKCILCNKEFLVAFGAPIPEEILLAGTRSDSPAVHINCILDMKKQIDELNKRNK